MENASGEGEMIREKHHSPRSVYEQKPLLSNRAGVTRYAKDPGERRSTVKSGLQYRNGFRSALGDMTLDWVPSCAENGLRQNFW